MQNLKHPKVLIKSLLPSDFFQKSVFPLALPDLPCVTVSVASISALQRLYQNCGGMSICLYNKAKKRKPKSFTKAHKVQLDEKQSKL